MAQFKGRGIRRVSSSTAPLPPAKMFRANFAPLSRLPWLFSVFSFHCSNPFLPLLLVSGGKGEVPDPFIFALILGIAVGAPDDTA